MRAGEDAEVLQLDDPSNDLRAAFLQWDEIGRLTKAEHRLIHCQYSPENRYKMTPEQWRRAAQVLAEEYGVAHHPRAVVLHAKGKNPHIHITFQRTDPVTLKAWDDSFSYVANERASLRLEKEFGHEIVPGKHVKRDRTKQPEFPRAKMSRAEAQLAKRTGKDLEKMKAELAAMKTAADSPQAFKSAVENAGFILANGERGYTLVDERGAAYNLARQLKVKVDAVNEYMKPVPLASLPTAEQAQARQAERRAVSKSNARKEAGKQAPEQAQPEQPQVAPEAFGPSQIVQKPEKKPRTLDPTVKAQIISLRARSDDAKAFKSALEEAGYTLAHGQSGYCVVSEADVFNLVRYAGSTKTKLDAFMAPIPLDTLPAVNEVIEAQRKAQKRPISPKAFKSTVESAGFILAKGEARYILVDEKGSAYDLARQLGMKLDVANEYMKSIPLASLPTAEQAQERQAERLASKSDARKERAQQAPREPRKPPEIDPAVKAQITSLRAWSDGAKAFKSALEEAGFTLARGQTGYCVVSDTDVFSLARHAGTTKAKLDALMAPIPLDTLPTVKEVIEAQREAKTEAQKHPSEMPVDFLSVPPHEPRPTATKEIDLGTRMQISALDMAAEAIAEAQRQARPNLDPELDALEKAIAQRHADEAIRLREGQELELRMKEVEMDREIARRMEGWKQAEDQQVETFLQNRKEKRTGIRGMIDAWNSRWNPTLAAENAKAREQERQNFYRRLAKERADYEVLLQQTKQLEIENLIERQRLRVTDFETKAAEDKERYIQEHHEAKRLRAEMEQERLKEEELERTESLGEGPPPPKLGK